MSKGDTDETKGGGDATSAEVTTGGACVGIEGFLIGLMRLEAPGAFLACCRGKMGE